MKDQETYEQEIAPLVRALNERARDLKFPCLIAVQVDGGVRMSGDLTGAVPQMQEAFAVLFQEDVTQP